MHQQAAIGYRENTLEKDNTSTSRRVDDSLRFDTHFFQWYFFQWEKQEQLLEEIFFVPIIMVCLSRWVEILFQLRLGVFAVESIAFEDVIRDSLSQRICSSVFCFFFSPWLLHHFCCYRKHHHFTMFDARCRNVCVSFINATAVCSTHFFVGTSRIAILFFPFGPSGSGEVFTRSNIPFFGTDGSQGRM